MSGRFDDDEKRLEKESSLDDATTETFISEEVEKGKWVEVMEYKDEYDQIGYTIAIPHGLLDMDEKTFLKVAEGVERCRLHILKKIMEGRAET